MPVDFFSISIFLVHRIRLVLLRKGDCRGGMGEQNVCCAGFEPGTSMHGGDSFAEDGSGHDDSGFHSKADLTVTYSVVKGTELDHP